MATLILRKTYSAMMEEMEALDKRKRHQKKLGRQLVMVILKKMVSIMQLEKSKV